MRRSTPVLITLLLLSGVGCVERKLTVTSDPPNALVYMNGRELGRTPIETDFIWYGTYDVQVRKDGFDTIKTASSVPYPWWQIPPIDLLAELMPWHPTDRKSLHYTLKPSQSEDTPSQLLIDRAGELKGQIESSMAK